MKEEEVRTLLDKYREGLLSEEELALLESWYLRKASSGQATPGDDELRANLRRVEKVVVGRTKPRGSVVKRFSAAAAVLLLLSLGIYLITVPRAGKQQSARVLNGQEIGPGGNKAMLILADGTTVDLSSVQEGIVVGDDGITYSDGTEILSPEAQKSENSEDGKTAYHLPPANLQLTTPEGGTYRIRLPDGTAVWLNAASTLTYPSHFTGNERIVELRGEAFFEVKQAHGMPFVVRSAEQEITVLGTEFNISAYPDETETTTTLVSGAVKVTMGPGPSPVTTHQSLLKPGEQAIVSAGGLKKRKVDVASAIAWKKGLFDFSDTELRTVMKQLSRWYDMEIEYRGTIRETHFFGQINRNNNLAAVLELLRESGLNFSIEQTNGKNKLVVLP